MGCMGSPFLESGMFFPPKYSSKTTSRTSVLHQTDPRACGSKRLGAWQAIWKTVLLSGSDTALVN